MTDKLSPTGLLPCAHCGSTNVSMSYSATMQSPEPSARFVECEDCVASGPPVDIINGNDFVATNLAIEKWNTRSLSASGDVESIFPRDELRFTRARAIELVRAALTASGNSGAVSDDLRADLELARLGDYPGSEGCKRLASRVEVLEAALGVFAAAPIAEKPAGSTVMRIVVPVNSIPTAKALLNEGERS